MKPERWRQINDLYHAALERDEAARAAFLDEACAPGGELDETLRREVESLLESNEEAGEFLSSSALVVAAKVLATDQNRFLIGQKVGHYQVLSLLGAGGMGHIYLAEDTRLNRKCRQPAISVEI